MTLAISPLDDRLNKALALASRTPKQITSETCSAAVEAYLKSNQIEEIAYKEDDEVRAKYDDWFVTKPASLDMCSSLEDIETYFVCINSW